MQRDAKGNALHCIGAFWGGMLCTVMWWKQQTQCNTLRRSDTTQRNAVDERVSTNRMANNGHMAPLGDLQQANAAVPTPLGTLASVVCHRCRLSGDAGADWGLGLGWEPGGRRRMGRGLAGGPGEGGGGPGGGGSQAPELLPRRWAGHGGDEGCGHQQAQDSRGTPPAAAGRPGRRWGERTCAAEDCSAGSRNAVTQKPQSH